MKSESTYNKIVPQDADLDTDGIAGILEWAFGVRYWVLGQCPVCLKFIQIYRERDEHLSA